MSEAKVKLGPRQARFLRELSTLPDQTWRPSPAMPWSRAKTKSGVFASLAAKGLTEPEGTGLMSLGIGGTGSGLVFAWRITDAGREWLAAFDKAGER